MKGNWFFLGIACILGSLFGLAGGFSPLVFLLIYLLYLSLFRKFSKKHLLAVVCFFLLFMLKGKLEEDVHRTKLTGAENEFLITLMHPLKLEGDLFSAYGIDEKRDEKLAIQYRIKSLPEQNQLRQLPIGLSCHVKGNLKEPEPARNPDAFNYKKYLHHEGIFWTLQVERFELNQCTKKQNPLLFIQNIRQKGIEHIHTHFPPHTAPLAAALIFGDRNSIAPDLLTAYQRLGIIHLIAISGLHVGMMMGMLLYIGLRFHVTREKMVYVLMAILPVYMIITGGAPSVVRACMMMLLALALTKFVKKSLIPLDILSIVFMAYVLVDPQVIYHVGFQLSFFVTLSLILSASILSKYMMKPIMLLVVTSLVCQIASMPILLYHFYEFSVVSFFANVLYVPLFTVITPLFLVFYFVHLFFGEVLNPLLSFFDFCLYWLNNLTLLFSKIPNSTWVLGRPTFIMFLLYGFGIPYALHRWEKARTKTQLFYALFIPFFLVGIQDTGGKLNPYGEVIMIDVGQGDSILIRFPFAQGTYLIDTGGTIRFPTEDWKERKDPFEVGKDVLVPFLKSKGITKLDKLILTHGDMDHVGGSMEVLNTLKVKEVVLPKMEERSELEEDIIAVAEEKNIRIHFGKKGDRWAVNGTTFTILSPSSDIEMERNDQSIVIHANIGGKGWLFTGDIEKDGEEKLLANYPALSADILKVGHHGSKTSTSESLVEKLKPEVALISAGKDNRFGHPHEEVLKRLVDEGINIYRTDRQGAITYRFKKKGGTFFTEIQYNKTKTKP